MANIEQLQRDLRVSELEAGTALYAELVAADVPPERIQGILYRRGWLDGKHEEKDRANRARAARIERYAAQQATSPTSGEIEGSDTNE